MKYACLVFSLLVVSCTVGPTVPKGQRTIQGKGSEALTNEGDPLLNSGMDVRNVPVEFAKGYTKGISEQVKRTYWERQESQRTEGQDLEGRTRYSAAENQDRRG